MNLFSKTGLTIAAIFFGLWIVGPLFLMVFFRLLNTSGGNIGLVVGFLKMVSVIGIVFAVGYAVAAYFGNPWLIASPILIVVLVSVVNSFRPMPPLTVTTHVTDTTDLATQRANEPGVELKTMLHFAKENMSPASAAAVAKIAEGRQRELAAQIAADQGLGDKALYAASLLTNPAPEVVSAVAASGHELVTDLRRFNELNQTSDCEFLGPVYRDRFRAWCAAWLAIQRQRRTSDRTLVEEILTQAKVRSQNCDAIEELRRAAQAALDNFSKATSP